MLLYNAHKKIDKGFTLVEMITAVIIVGVIAAIAAPNLLGMLNQTRVKDGLGQVEGAVREAQKRAINRGKTCKIKFVTKTIDGKSRQTMNVVESTDSGETVAAGYYDGCLLNERILPIDVAVNTGGITKITFSGKGNADAASAGTIVVSHPNTNTQKCLQIEGILGNIITGDYIDTDSDGTADDCDAK